MSEANPLAARLRAAGSELRDTPFGVLVLAGLLAVLGLGLFAAAVYLLATGEVRWLNVGALAAGPLLLYFAVQLARCVPWAWLTTLLLLVLLAVSSALRALFTPDPLAPLAELAVEATFLWYVFRPHVRRAFRRAG